MPWDHAPGGAIIEELGGYVGYFNTDGYRPSQAETATGILAARDRATWDEVHRRTARRGLTLQERRVRGSMKVAFLGLGVMGFPDGRASEEGGARRHGLQPHGAPNPRNGSETAARAAPPRPRARPPRAPRSSSPASATTTTCAASVHGAGRRLRRHGEGRDRSSTTPRPRPRWRANWRAAGEQARASASWMRRSPAARPAPRTASSAVMVRRRRRSDFDRAEPVIDALRQGLHPAGPGRQRASSPRW